MAKASSTKKKKSPANWCDLDDANLGRIIKKDLKALEDLKNNDLAKALRTFVVALICANLELNAATARYTVEDLMWKGTSSGDWLVTVKRVKKRKKR